MNTELGGAPALEIAPHEPQVMHPDAAPIDALIGSTLAQLDTPLGSYRFSLIGSAGGPSQLRLSTIDGALQLKGEGTAGANGVRFRGEASAATEADEAALNNLLNIIGRRNGAVSVISIG